MNKSALIFAFSLAGLATVGVRAESATSEPTVPAVVPPAAAAKPSVGSHLTQSMGQSPLTPDENKILGKARMELQKDPEILELNAQLKALMEKRAKLTEEKLQKISPEAAAIVQKLKDAQEKMQAERKAQMEAMQAKYKAQQEAQKPVVAPDKPEVAPASPTSP